MTNREYVEDLLALNEKIYIDTSSLMNDTELGRFLVQYQDIFGSLDKKNNCYSRSMFRNC
jgi:hypothetical protein